MEQVTGKRALQDALLSSRQRTEAGYSAECCRGGKRQAGTGAYVVTTSCLANAFVHLLGRSVVLGYDVINADLRQAPAPAEQ